MPLTTVQDAQARCAVLAPAVRQRQALHRPGPAATAYQGTLRPGAPAAVRTTALPEQDAHTECARIHSMGRMRRCAGLREAAVWRVQGGQSAHY
jgi:hypothetical protein